MLSLKKNYIKRKKTLQFHRNDIFSHEFKHVLHIGSVIFRMYNEILPILDTGKNVILDRYVLCIKLFTELFLQPSCNCLSKALECLPNPDIGIYLNVDVDIAIARIQQRRLLEASIHLQQAEHIQAADYSGLRTILQDIRSVTKKVDTH